MAPPFARLDSESLQVLPVESSEMVGRDSRPDGKRGETPGQRPGVSTASGGFSDGVSEIESSVANQSSKSPMSGR